ncbi:FAGR028Cp [Eremothecium gossypii FDAG1]|nr:FAGR028Cp [Eremothecium gossypii FDAG1]
MRAREIFSARRGPAWSGAEPRMDGQDAEAGAPGDIVAHADLGVAPAGAGAPSSKFLRFYRAATARSRRASGRRGRASPRRGGAADSSVDEGATAVPSSRDAAEEESPRRKQPVRVPQTPAKLAAPALEADDSDGFVTARSTPLRSPRRQLTFSSPSKSPRKTRKQDVLLAQVPSFKLDPGFVPAAVPKGYRLPEDRNLTYFFDGFEGYIDQKKPIRAHKKSRNSMAIAPSVSRDEFRLLSGALNGFMHQTPRAVLTGHQQRLFPQYWFEVMQGFTLLFYGIGSKRRFLETLVFEYLSPKLALSGAPEGADVEGVPCVVINGFNPACNYRDCFQSIAAYMLPDELRHAETKYWHNHVHLQIQKMVEHWAAQPPQVQMVVLVHNLDGPMLRKDPFQQMLSSLARIRQIAIVASVDHIHAPLLWDSLRAQLYNFVFHDVTNYEPYAIEAAFQESVRLNRSELQAGSIDAARYVLASLTANSKRLFRLLLETVVANMQSAKRIKLTNSRRAGISFGVPFSAFYQACAAQFVASNEMSLRSMLREFVEHKMAHLAKDKAGQEIVYVNYSFGEMQKLLSDALSSV